MIVSIHQPNLFPWLGFFDKISRSDTFVYLDHVENTRTQLQGKRVKILMNGVPKWLSIPLKKDKRSALPLAEMKIQTADRNLEKQLKTLKQNYSNHPFFEEVFPFVNAYYQHDSAFLVERNIDFIEKICEKLEITTARVRSSALEPKETGTDLLIELIQKVAGQTYMCGGGADGYQEDKKFDAAGIALLYQSFDHPVYRQEKSDDFVEGLSITDALMNLGFHGTNKLLSKTAGKK